MESRFRKAAAPPSDIVRSEAEIVAARRLLAYEPRYSRRSNKAP